MNKHFSHIVTTSIALLGSVMTLYATEPELMTDRLAYNIEFDPTTVFLMSEPESVNDKAMTEDMIAFATTFLGKPYRKGAKGPNSFDCSGFTSYVFKNFGISLSSSSREQFNQGSKIEIEEVMPGDLLFFKGRKTSTIVGHVGMVVDVDDKGTVTFIHAATSGGIRYDKYPDGGYYSNRFIGAKRILDQD